METTLILIEFILIYLTLKSIDVRYSKVKIIVQTFLIFSSIVILMTEILNIFGLMTYIGLITSWSTLIIITFTLLFFYGKPKTVNRSLNWKEIISPFSKIPNYYFYFIFGIVTLIFLQGILYPPNNWDSMTYHLARIPNWIGNGTINHYPTHIYRQLYQPPFSSFLNLHLALLNSTDYLSNTIQLFYLLGSIAVIISILNIYKASIKTKILAVVLTLTIPEVLLQASSTQNDIIVSFFILSCGYFAIKSYKAPLIKGNYFYLGASIGLALQTKATAYIFLTPVLLIFGVYFIISTIKTKEFKKISYSISVIILTLALNFGHYNRNYKLTGSLLGVDKTESSMYSNQAMSPSLFFLNLLKNASLHIGPFPVNKFSERLTVFLHDILDVKTNNIETNFNGIEYQGAPNTPIHEDTAPNFLHFYLILVSIPILVISLIKRKINQEINLIVLSIFLLQIVFFCGYLKFQIWHTRLHTPLFFLSIPLVMLALNISPNLKLILKKFLPFFMLYSIFIVVFNKSRPLINTGFTNRISIFDDRYEKYFSNQPELYPEYKNILSILESQKNQNIGLILNIDSWEYPLFSSLIEMQIFPQHIDVENISKSIPISDTKINFIISTKDNGNEIDHSGKIFQNLTLSNRKIWLYKNSEY